MLKKRNLSKIEQPTKNKSSEGHRRRLRDRFLQSGLDGFLDYEIVELLLTLGTPRKDCKQVAKVAIKTFKGLQGVLDSSLDELQTIKGIGPSNAFGIKLFQAISERYAKEKIPSKILLSSPHEVVTYLKEKLGREKKEHFVLIALDAQNNLINISNISVGILNASLVHPREVFKEALRYSAATIIIAHNHPSDNPEASPEDIALTRRLEDAAKIIGIELADHIVVTKNKYFSLREQGLM